MPKPLSYTRISTYTYTCPFAYYLKYVENLQTSKTSLARVWGSSLHKAIQLWHMGMQQDDLKQAFDLQFSTELAPWPEIAMAADNMIGLLPDYIDLMDTLSETYKAPTATTAYKTSEVVTKLKKLEEMASTAAADTNLAYSVREGILHKFIQHKAVAEHYLTFNNINPIMMLEDGTPAVEIDLEFTLGQDQCRAIIDQIRLNEHGAFPLDLKSSMVPLPAEILANNYQLTHYQLAMALTKNLPNPVGAAHYNLRTGETVWQDAITTEQAEEWMQNILMVMAAEKHRIFPRRRDDKCLRCDWYEDHCSKNTGAI